MKETILVVASAATLMTLEQALVAGMVTLAGVVSVLYRSIRRQHLADRRQLETKLDQCETKHEANDAKVLELVKEVAYLRGQQDGLRTLATQVLQVVEENRQAGLTAKGQRAEP
jgi:hypothetical protein